MPLADFFFGDVLNSWHLSKLWSENTVWMYWQNWQMQLLWGEEEEKPTRPRDVN